MPILDKDLKLLNIVAFCLLMQDIQDKSPDYIREKFARYALSDDLEMIWGLDKQKKFDLVFYLEKWDLIGGITDKLTTEQMIGLLQ